jgi:hypothetical protein
MKRLTPSEYIGLFNRLTDEQSEYLTEWRVINDYLLPGRTLDYGTTKPRKRSFAPTKAVNMHASLALDILASGFHGGLTSPARPWFSYNWSDDRVKQIPQLVAWLDDALVAMYDALSKSNFYETMRAGYSEFGGYGNICVGLFEDEKTKGKLQFQLLTVGEYVCILDPGGALIGLFRQTFMNYESIFKRWPNTCSDAVKTNHKTSPYELRPVLHVVHEISGYKKPWISQYIELGASEVLSTGGFDECPYFFAPWDIIGSDYYGSGPGSKALPDIKRLQEIEKAFLMAAHKSLDPPVDAPAHRRGKINTLPGAVNYYRSQNEKVEPLYTVKFDYQGAMAAVERIEQRIGRFFFNEVFLTASRDPNASPLKATEVNERKEEKLLRLGPVLERLHTLVLKPLLLRAFGILRRAGKIEELPPELEKIANFDIEFVSILAKSQKLIETRTVTDTISFAASMASVKPEVLDNIDGDAALREYADTVGAPQTILVAATEVAKIREARQKQIAMKEQQQAMLAQQQQGLEANKAQSEVAKNYAGAGVDVRESLQGL